MKSSFLDFEYSAVYRSEEPKIELYSRNLNSDEYRPREPNIGLFIRLLNIVLNIDLTSQI